MAKTERLLKNPYPAEYVDNIIERVCSDTGIEVSKISAYCRTRDLADSRKIVAYLCDKYVAIPLRLVAKRFNQGNHTTVTNQKNSCIDLMKVDASFRQRVERIEAEFLLN
jgi:chromosomal replication initiation ATPase DnaA